jgi:universal stress protein A
VIVLKRILVPTDFSDTSAAAVNYGVAFARAFGATLIVLHVEDHREFEMIVESQRVVDDILGGPARIPAIEPAATVAHAARELMAAALTPQQAQGLAVEYVLRDGGFGAPYAAIVKYAQEQEIDLIIMGTHGRGRVAHMLMGGVAEHVVRRAPCPVLTVRHPEHDFIVPDEPIAGVAP